MATMLLMNSNHKPPGPGGGQFAPKGGGSSGGTSTARMARITRQAVHATAKHGMTRQCAYCGKMLNGPMKGTRIALPHRTPAGSHWTHGMCPDCAGKMSQYLKERTAGHVSPTLKRWESHFEAMQRDQAARIQADAGTQAAEGSRGMRLADIWSRPIRLEETSSDGKHRTWLMFMPLGEFEHPEYGKLQFTEGKLKKFKANFDKRTRKIDIALDADHKATQGDSRATGWVEAMELRPDGLWASVAWTSYGVQLLSEDIYRYFSPEFGDYTDEETGETFHDVPIGGALTNRPFLKVMPAIKLSEVSNRAWGSVSKSDLPKSCFLWVAGPNKSDWHLPVYESNGQGGRGALNRNGVKAAYAALHGARTGTPMSVPSSVRAKVVSLYNRLFGNHQATETREGTMARTYQFGAAKTPLKAKGGGGNAPASDVTDYDPDNVDDATQFDDGEEDDASMDDSGTDDSESYDDSSDDDASMDDSSDDSSGDADTSTLGRRGGRGGKTMSRKASSKAASRSGGRKMSEVTLSRQLAEVRAAMAERDQQLAELQYRDYTRGVEDILRTWSDGKTVTFFASETASLPRGKVSKIGGRRVERARTVALTPEAARRVREFLLDEGYQLSDRRRTKVLDLIQFLLSERAQVDLTRYGNSFDMDARRTVTLASRQRETLEGADLHEIAESLASQAGKTFAMLSLDEKQHFYQLAEQEA